MKAYRLLVLSVLLVILVLTIPAGAQPAQQAEGTLPPMILLPGLTASALSNYPTCGDRPNGEVWPNLGWIWWPPTYNAGLETLYLDETGRLPAHGCDHILPSGILMDVLGTDYYGQFIAEMEALGYTVHAYDYDWRLDLEDLAQELDAYVDGVAGPDGVILIGHSLGGVLARQYVSDPTRADKVNRVISVGSPYWGAPEAALSMREGSMPNGFLSLVTYAEVVRQLVRNSPAMMEILPSRTLFGQGSYYYISNSDPLQSYPETMNFFVNRGQNDALLGEAHQLHLALDDFRGAITVPYDVLTTNHAQAVGRIHEYSCWFGLLTCWDVTRYAAGDGTVPWVSARLSGRLGNWSGDAEVCTYYPGSVSHVHSELLSDSNVIDDVKRILANQPPVNCVGEQAAAPDIEPQPLLQIAVMGNAIVNVYDAQGNHSGVTEQGLVVNQIPAASYHRGPSATFVVLPAGAAARLEVTRPEAPPAQGPSEALLQIRLTEFRSPSLETSFVPVRRAVFVDPPLRAGGTASLVLGPQTDLGELQMVLDADRNGAPDLTLAPSSLLGREGSQDITPPTSRIEAQPVAGQTTVTVSAVDAGSGVLMTEVSLDGGQSWQRYTAPLTVEAGGASTILARTVDRAGNYEYPATSLLLEH